MLSRVRKWCINRRRRGPSWAADRRPRAAAASFPARVQVRGPPQESSSADTATAIRGFATRRHSSSPDSCVSPSFESPGRAMAPNEYAPQERTQAHQQTASHIRVDKRHLPWWGLACLAASPEPLEAHVGHATPRRHGARRGPHAVAHKRKDPHQPLGQHAGHSQVHHLQRIADVYRTDKDSERAMDLSEKPDTRESPASCTSTQSRAKKEAKELTWRMSNPIIW